MDIITYALGKKYTDSKVTELTGFDMSSITEQLKLQNSQEQTLSHGLNTIESDQASPMKVEFYGDTLVNILGKQNTYSEMNAISISNIGLNESGGATIVSSNNGFKKVRVETGKHYLLVVNWGVGTNNNINLLRAYFGSVMEDGTLLANFTNNNNISYAKFTPPNTDDISLAMRNGVEGSNYKFSNALLIEISQSTYDKIGVSLTDADVERMFPYVNSVQHVKNPVVRVSGANLLPPFSEWTLPSNAIIKNAYEVDISATGWNQGGEITFNALQNQKYTFNGDAVYALEIKSINTLGVATNLYSGIGVLTFPYTFTTPSDTKKLTIKFKNSVSQTGIYTVKQPMLNLGSTAKPFTPKNDSYLYAETVLAGNDNKKDILFKNESLNRWEKIKNWETDVLLNGSYDWAYNNSLPDNPNALLVKLNGLLTYNPSASYLTSFNGTPLPYYDITKNAESYRTLSDGVQIVLPHSLTGFIEGMTLTTDLIKSYFYGFKYFGDGTTHKWRPIGDVDATRETTVLPTSPSPTIAEGKIQPYKLTYQLASPVIEVEGIDFPLVEGDLSIQGDAQVDVGEGVIVREVANPTESTSNGDWHLNLLDGTYGSVPSGNQLNYKNLRFIDIYKNGESDIRNWIILNNSAYGEQRAYTTSTLFDSTATYTVTYEIADKHTFTTNLNEVKATFQNSMKSSFQSAIAKQSDIATDQTILKRQMLDVLIRLEAGGL